MNILPKKRWHVRTKENIARVRKDEAEAAEKERLEQERIANADKEARLNFLKQKSTLKLLESGVVTSDSEIGHEISLLTEDGHVNLFGNLEQAVTATNKEHDKEKKQKQEEYEKKIGYLTYLGQNTNEELGIKNWYEVPPECSRFGSSKNVKVSYDKLVLKDADGKPKSIEQDFTFGEVEWKSKQRSDPLNKFKKLKTSISESKESTKLKKELKAERSDKYQSIYKHKSHKIYNKKEHKQYEEKDNKKAKLAKLREARLKREQEEQRRTQVFLTGGIHTKPAARTEPTCNIKRKYNSQFNPELAKQNR